MRNYTPIGIKPKQATFIKYYTDPQSPTRGNAYQSAIRARYSRSYARVITRLWKGEKIQENKELAYMWASIYEDLRELPDWGGG